MKLHPPPPFDIHVTDIQNDKEIYQFYGTWMDTPIHGTISTENNGDRFFAIHIPTQQPTIQWIDNKPQNIPHHDDIPIIRINTTLDKLTPILQSKNINTLKQKIQHLLSTYMNPELYERHNHVCNIFQYLYHNNPSIKIRRPKENIYHLYDGDNIIWHDMHKTNEWTSTNHLTFNGYWKNAPSIISIIYTIDMVYIDQTWKNESVSQHSYIKSIRYLQHHEAPSLPCI